VTLAEWATKRGHASGCDGPYGRSGCKCAKCLANPTGCECGLVRALAESRDHALLLAALVAGRVGTTWPAGSSVITVWLHGLLDPVDTTLDSYGCPILTDALRKALEVG